MFVSRLCIFTLIFALAGMATFGQDQPTAAADRIHLKLDTDEDEAVLAILDKRAAGTAVADSDWQRLFATEPYVRLKKREASMHRDFTDDDFRTFLLSADQMANASALRHALNAWRRADLVASARQALAYLPDQATIKAKVFPVIKPKTNSFVFDTALDPAIFLYLDPQESAAKFENTVAHERITSVSPVSRRCLRQSRRAYHRTPGRQSSGWARSARVLPCWLRQVVPMSIHMRQVPRRSMHVGTMT